MAAFEESFVNVRVAVCPPGWYPVGPAAKKLILDELCATTGLHRDHARRALQEALVLRVVEARPPLHGEAVMAALRFC